MNWQVGEKVNLRHLTSQGKVKSVPGKIIHVADDKIIAIPTLEGETKAVAEHLFKASGSDLLQVSFHFDPATGELLPEQRQSFARFKLDIKLMKTV